MNSTLLVGPALIVGLGGFVLWIWALIDVLRTSDDRFRTGSQLIWVLVIVFTTVVGALIYLAIGRPRRQPAVG